MRTAANQRVRNEGAGRKSGQFLPDVCGGCGAYVRDRHATAKQQAECRADALGIAIVRETPTVVGDPIGELIAPDGKRFDGDTHALTFTDWRDALNQLREVVLTSCLSDCDCNSEAGT